MEEIADNKEISRFERIVKFTPAYDKRGEGYGIHNCQLFMVLKGAEGAVVFTMSTGWFLKSTTQWLKECHQKTGGLINDWRGSSVGYCSPKQLHDYETPRENCDWLGCTCYGDVSYTISDEVAGLLIEKGDESVWEWLENWYNQQFNSGK